MLTGELNERITVLTFDGAHWKKKDKIWGKCTEKNTRCIFSQNGVSALKTMIVSTYKENKASEVNLLEIRGKKYLPVSVIPNKNPVYKDVTSAPVLVKTMIMYKNVTETDENRLVTSTKTEEKETDVIFANKYVALNSNAVFNTENRAFIILIPKDINIDAGTIVKIDNTFYYVTLTLEYGDFFNEYQIEVKEDI